jgi:UDP-glucose 4-epimerase
MQGASMKGPILVTGAGGLVGRALVARLAPFNRVFALVRENPPRPLPAGVDPIIHDLCSRGDPQLPEVPATIVHLAQSSSYQEFPARALDIFEVNVGSTQRLLDWAHRRGVERFIYASSGGVYGHGEAAFDEDAPLGGTSAYGHHIASKRCGELLANAYNGSMIIVMLRFFFAYGPGQRRSMLIPRLIDNVLNRRPINLQGNDGLRANPVWVDDAAAAVEAATSLQVGQTINVAGPQVLSLRDIATLIGELTGCRPLLQVEPDAEPRHLVGSIDKMTRLLGAPKIGPADGLRRMIAAERTSTAECRA